MILIDYGTKVNSSGALRLRLMRPTHIYRSKQSNLANRGLANVLKFANMTHMRYALEYFHARVKEDVESWPDGILADYARLVELLLEFGPNLRMPHSRAMGAGLFELRPRGREGIGRALYCYFDGQRIVILHAFVKKTQETPEKDLRLARKRMKEVQNG